MITLFLERLRSPIGTTLVLSDERDRLRALDWQDYETRMQRLLRLHYGKDAVRIVERERSSQLRNKLRAYFAGEVSAVETIEVETAGTAFQRTVWQALRRIQPGTTVSYGALAASIGRPKAVRAVGLANGCNPIGIVVPCHRVIGANSSLTGYAGGLERKRWLLEHERQQSKQASQRRTLLHAPASRYSLVTSH